MRLDQANAIAEKLTDKLKEADSIYGNGQLNPSYTVFNREEVVTVSLDFQDRTSGLVNYLFEILRSHDFKVDIFFCISNFPRLVFHASTKKAHTLIKLLNDENIKIFDPVKLLLKQLERMPLIKMNVIHVDHEGAIINFQNKISFETVLLILQGFESHFIRQYPLTLVIENADKFTHNRIWDVYVEEMLTVCAPFSGQALLNQLDRLIPNDIFHVNSNKLKQVLEKVNSSLSRAVSTYSQMKNDTTLSAAIVSYADQVMVDQAIDLQNKLHELNCLADFMAEGVEYPKESLFFKDKSSQEFQLTFKYLRSKGMELIKNRFEEILNSKERNLKELKIFGAVLSDISLCCLFKLNTDVFFNALSKNRWTAFLATTNSIDEIKYYRKMVKKFITDFVPSNPAKLIEDFEIIERDNLIDESGQVKQNNQPGLLHRQSMFDKVDNQPSVRNENFQTMLPAIALPIISVISSELTAIVVQRKKNQLGATSSSSIQVNSAELDVSLVMQALVLSHLTLLSGSSSTVLSHNSFIKKLTDAGIFENNLIAHFNQFLEKAISNNGNDCLLRNVMKSSPQRDEFDCLKICMAEFRTKASSSIGYMADTLSAKLMTSLDDTIETLKSLFSVKSPSLTR